MTCRSYGAGLVCAALRGWYKSWPAGVGAEFARSGVSDNSRLTWEYGAENYSIRDPCVLPVAAQRVQSAAGEHWSLLNVYRAALCTRNFHTKKGGNILGVRLAKSVWQVIRETWGNGHDNVYFVVGDTCSIPPPDRPEEPYGLCKWYITLSHHEASALHGVCGKPHRLLDHWWWQEIGARCRCSIYGSRGKMGG